jgi:hypothetical protein
MIQAEEEARSMSTERVTFIMINILCPVKYQQALHLVEGMC